MMRFAARSSRTSSDGFTVVEVLVATIVMAMVAAVVARSVVASGSSQLRSKARTQQTALADGALERLQADGTWSKRTTCINTVGKPASQGCFISDAAVDCGAGTSAMDAAGWCIVTTATDTGAQRFRVRVLGSGYDSAADGTGLVKGSADPDRDGLIPDFYHVIVEVQAETGTNTFDVNGTQRLEGDVNPVMRANAGSVEIRTCMLTTQVDHRQPVTVCHASPSLQMYPPVGYTSTNDGRYKSGSSGGSSSVDGVAWSVAGSMDPSKLELEFRPVGNVRYTLSPITSVGAPDPSRPVITGSTDAKGIGVTPSVTAGQYRVTFQNLPPGAAPWNDHSLPGDGLLSVSTGSTTHVSQVFEPIPRAVTINFSWRHDHVRRDFVGDPGTVLYTEYELNYHDNNSLRLIAAPLERVPINGVNPTGRVLGDGVTLRVNSTDSTATFTNVAPGLYSPYLVEGGGTSNVFQRGAVTDQRLDVGPLFPGTVGGPPSAVYPRSLDFLWVDADGTVTGGDAGATINTFWLNDYDQSCEPMGTPQCGAGGGGGGGGGASPSGGSGGL